MNIVIVFNNNMDLEYCRGFLYRQGAAYEQGTFRNANYLVIINASEDVENNFFREDIFLEYSDQMKIGAFENNNPRACKFITNCYAKDLPMVEDVYEIYRTYRKHMEQDESTFPDMYCFGLSDTIWETIESIEPGLTKKVQKNLYNDQIAQSRGQKNTIHFVCTAFHLGWHTRYICILLPDENNTERYPEEYLRHALRSIRRFLHNHNYKHTPKVFIHEESIGRDYEEIDKLINSLPLTSDVTEWDYME